MRESRRRTVAGSPIGLLALVARLVTAACMAAGSTPTSAMDWVTVGNPGNAHDTTGYGAVNYGYRIGKYEVTIRQYTDFLNAVDPDGTNAFGLYNNAMGTNANVRGILYSSGSASGQKYRPSGSATRPITYVSWFDAARFANWMQNGQGSGSTETGAYTLVGGQTSGTAPAKNPGAQFSIPTENEWYKAAYFSPLLNSGSGSYYAYATQNNTAPGNTIGSGANQANYFAGDYTVTQSSVYWSSQNYLTNAGAFTNSASYYGTFDQTGNVYEWNDLTSASGTSRGLRGGMWAKETSDDAFFGSSSARGTPSSTFESVGHGFRLASSGALVVTGSQSFTNDVQESGNVTTGGFARFNNGYEGALAVSGGTASFAGSVTGTVNVSGGGAAMFTTGAGFSEGLLSLSAGSQASFNPGAGSVIVAAGTITGSGSLAKSGPGTLTLTANNTYTGTTTVSAGTLAIGGGGTTGSVAGDIANNAAVAFNRSNALTYANAITGTGTLTKQGDGDLVLTGTSSYTGATAVAGGRLSVDGVLGNSPVAVLAAAELGGSGSIGGAVSVAGGGTLSPGNSVESLATGAVTFAAGATFEYEVDSTNLAALGTAADLLVVSGDLDLDPGNGTILALTDLAGSPSPFVNHTTIFALVNYAGAWNGGLFTYGGNVLADGDWFTVGSQEWMIDYNRSSSAGIDNFTGDFLPSGRFVTITAVPEPSTWAMALAGLACGGWAIRRRQRA